MNLNCCYKMKVNVIVQLKHLEVTTRVWYQYFDAILFFLISLYFLGFSSLVFFWFRCYHVDLETRQTTMTMRLMDSTVHFVAQKCFLSWWCFVAHFKIASHILYVYTVQYTFVHLLVDPTRNARKIMLLILLSLTSHVIL